MASVKPRIPFMWIPDEKSTKCHLCDSEFSMVNRKHHCRSCGKIFCYNCCYQYQSLPSYIPSTHKRYCDGKEHRVCNTCIREITYIKQNKKLIIIFSYLPLTMEELYSIRLVSKAWKSAFDSILSVFKSFHFKLGYQKWSGIERRILNTHWKEFKGHSRLMIQAIRGLRGIVDISKIARYYKDELRETDCTYLFCNKDCTAHINTFDLIDLICSFPSQQILQVQEMESWVGQCLTNLNKEWLSILIPWFVQPYTPPNLPLQRIIANNVIPIVHNDIHLAYKMYFTCLVLSHDKHSSYYSSIIDRLLEMTPYKDLIIKTHKFIETIKYPDRISEYDFKGIRMPFNPDIIIKDVQTVNIKRLNTFTKPWIIPIETFMHGTINILVKHDDIRKDKFVMDIISMMKLIHKDINLNVYHIMPITIEFGIIEMLPKVKTLFDIDKETTLSNYIINNNVNKPMIEVRRGFISSCASNCVLTFMLGIGDRNLQNILVSQDGTLSHIDFSYILGTDPKWEELTEMRITPGMVDLLGGKQSNDFTLLKETCSNMFNDIKQYTYFWYALFRYLGYTEPPMEPHYRNFNEIELHIEKRLMPDASEEEVTMTIAEIVEKNSGSQVAGWVDSFHNLKSSVEGMIFRISM